jgi:threonine aldolase
LGAPAGSLLLGNKPFIDKARRVRKVLGGGMRQAGILAAAGMYALKNNVSRLKEDHKNATMIEAELQRLSYVKKIMPVESNIIIFDLDERIKVDVFVHHLRQNQILCTGFGSQSIRMVTHLDAEHHACAKVCEVLANSRF